MALYTIYTVIPYDYPNIILSIQARRFARGINRISLYAVGRGLTGMVIYEYKKTHPSEGLYMGKGTCLLNAEINYEISIRLD